MKEKRWAHHAAAPLSSAATSPSRFEESEGFGYGKVRPVPSLVSALVARGEFVGKVSITDYFHGRLPGVFALVKRHENGSSSPAMSEGKQSAGSGERQMSHA